MKMRPGVAALAACLAWPALARDSIKTPADAFNAGQAFSNSDKGTGAASGTINAAAGSANVPKYNTNPPEAGIYGAGRSLIGAAGSTKQTACRDYRAGTAYDQQECDAVNYLTNMPSERLRFVIDKSRDPLMVNSKEVFANPGSVPASGTSACHIEKSTIPGTVTTETCEETRTLEDTTCTRTYMPVIREMPTGISLNENHGAEVPNWNANTFTYNMTIEGAPSGMLLSWFQSDNFGQLWVNDTLVYQYVFNGAWLDLRNSSTRRQGFSVHLVSEAGVDYGSYFDTGCAGACRGVSPNIDLTALFKVGDNKIVMSCVNAERAGPCAVKIVGNDMKPAVVEIAYDNRCEAFEARARSK